MAEYYDEKTECMPQEQLRELQLKLLNQQLKRARKTVFYKDMVSGVNSLDDFRQIKCTDKKDFYKTKLEHFLSIPLKEIVRFTSTSGTTGTPIIMALSKQDDKNIATITARYLFSAGMREGDILQSMFSASLAASGWSYYRVLDEMKIILLPTGYGNTQRQISFLKQFGAKYAACTPGYLQHLISSITDFKDICLKKAIILGEGISQRARDVMLSTYGLETFIGYGCSECVGSLANECSCHSGLHIAEDYFYVEIINPDTGLPVPDGEYGELVVTPLQQEAMPLIRYRTRDITRIIPGTCPCGRTHRRIEPITHRIDDMMIINGANVFPSQIEECIYKHISTATNYLIHITEKEGLKKLLIDIELTNDLLCNSAGLKKLEKELIDTMKSYITVTPKLNFVPFGTLPEIQGKVKRVVKD